MKKFDLLDSVKFRKFLYSDVRFLKRLHTLKRYIYTASLSVQIVFLFQHEIVTKKQPQRSFYGIFGGEIAIDHQPSQKHIFEHVLIKELKTDVHVSVNNVIC